MEYTGIVWKFGDNIDTDVIIPAQYLESTDPEYLGRHCMEPIRPHFSQCVQRGDIIVAGKNFGCGSSREHAPIAIKACGISAVIARSFARIFFRNSINTGLTVIEQPNIFEIINEGDKLYINMIQGIIKHAGTEQEFRISPFPEFLRKIIDAGGLMNYYFKSKGE
jgi:3-isopropylmalate dehydratase small subunit